VSNGQTSTRAFFDDLQSAVQANPVPAALIGMGALWMLMGGGRTTAAAAMISGGASRAADTLAPVTNAFASGAGKIGEGLASLASRASDAVGDTIALTQNAVTSAADQLTSGAAEVPASMRKNADSMAKTSSAVAGSVQSNLTETFERQPLLVGLVGIAVGAAIATAFPKTQIEEEYVGDAAKKAKEEVQSFVTEQSENLQKTASRTLEAVKDEASVQGLTPDALKQGAAAIRDKAVSAASAARRNKGQTTRQ